MSRQRAKTYPASLSASALDLVRDLPSFKALLAKVRDPNALSDQTRLGFNKAPLWALACMVGPHALEALRSAGCAFTPREGHSVATFCRARHLPESFSWEIRRKASPSTRAARSAWRMAFSMAEKTFHHEQSIGEAMSSSEQRAALATESAAAAFGPPPSPLLRELVRAGRFVALRFALSHAQLNAKSAQALCEARPRAPRPLITGFAGLPIDERPATRQAAKAGAILSAHAPKLDLARDARTLSPACVAFSLAAGALPHEASEPPLAALCHAASEAASPSNKGWAFMAELAVRGARGAMPPEAYCARLLAEAGCLALAHLPGKPSAMGVCNQTLARHRSAAGSKSNIKKLAQMSSLVAWVAKELSAEGTCEELKSPLAQMAQIVSAKADIEALENATASAPSLQKSSARL